MAQRSPRCQPTDTSTIYKMRYKGISLALDIMSSSLIGSYVNFGVFKLYGDPALQNALQVSLNLLLSIPLSEVMAYPKVARSYFTFIEVIFRHQLETIVLIPTKTFLHIVKSLEEGLLSVDSSVAIFASSTIDHLASFQFRVARRNKPEARALQQHFNNAQNFYCFSDDTVQETHISRRRELLVVVSSVLSIILASEDAYNDAAASAQF